MRQQSAIAKKGNSKMKRARLHAGQALIEYALLLVLVAVMVMISLMALGPAIGNIYSTIIASI